MGHLVVVVQVATTFQEVVVGLILTHNETVCCDHKHIQIGDLPQRMEISPMKNVLRILKRELGYEKGKIKKCLYLYFLY